MGSSHNGNGHSAKKALGGLRKRAKPAQPKFVPSSIAGSAELFFDRRTEGRRTAPGHRYRSDSPYATAEPVSYSSSQADENLVRDLRRGEVVHKPFVSAEQYDQEEGGHPSQPWYPPRYS